MIYFYSCINKLIAFTSPITLSICANFIIDKASEVLVDKKPPRNLVFKFSGGRLIFLFFSFSFSFSFSVFLSQAVV